MNPGGGIEQQTGRLRPLPVEDSVARMRRNALKIIDSQGACQDAEEGTKDFGLRVIVAAKDSILGRKVVIDANASVRNAIVR